MVSVPAFSISGHGGHCCLHPAISVHCAFLPVHNQYYFVLLSQTNPCKTHQSLTAYKNVQGVGILLQGTVNIFCIHIRKVPIKSVEIS